MKRISFTQSITCLAFAILLAILAGCQKESTPEYSLTVGVQPAQSGSVTVSPLNSTYAENSQVTLMTNPAANYKFVSWSGNDAAYVVNNKIVMTKDMSIVANFELITFSITGSVYPANSGVVNGFNTYTYGQTATLMATPNSGFEFVNWTENSSVVSSNATYSFTVTSNRNLMANFVQSTMIRLKSGTGLNSGAHIYFVALSKNQNYFNLTVDEMFSYRKTDADWYIDGDVIPFTTDYKSFDLETGQYYFLMSASGTVMITTVNVLAGKQTFRIYASGASIFVSVEGDKKSGEMIEGSKNRIQQYFRNSSNLLITK
jgi:hypothetical protein